MRGIIMGIDMLSSCVGKIDYGHVDYKELLIKYMKMILKCEGMSYVRGDMEDFTENEVKELRRIAAENEALDEN